MDTFIARQPIFNLHRRLFAYELLYRGSGETELNNVSGNRATSTLLTSAFFTEGLEKLTNSKPAFINFTEDLLLRNIPLNFPKTKIIVEILESVRPTTEIIEACKNLKKKGYILALDDFDYDKGLMPLIELVDIIKFDFHLTKPDEMQRIFRKLEHFDIEYLAEKIETMEEFETALKQGFSYFQGYFFATPENIKIKEIVASKFNLLKLLTEINRREMIHEKLVEFIETDVSLSYKLLRYINSSYFYRISKIESIAHAVAFLGEREIKRFVSLVIISELATEKPTELVRLALTRARFCEQLAEESSQAMAPEELFLLGLFSLLDAMLDRPIEVAITKLPLDDFLKYALTQNQGPYAPYLNTVLSYERRDKDGCLSAINAIGVAKEKIYPMYLSSLEYADSLTRL